MIASAAALDDAGMDWPAIKRIVIARGPGGFSALRAGLAFAQGAAAASGAELVGVSLFAVLRDSRANVAAALPAGRGELFLRAPNGEDRVADPETLAAWLGDATTPLVGPGADALAAAGGGNVLSTDPPALDALARIGAARTREERALPLYLRPPAVTPAGRDAAARLAR